MVAFSSIHLNGNSSSQTDGGNVSHCLSFVCSLPGWHSATKPGSSHSNTCQRLEENRQKTSGAAALEDELYPVQREPLHHFVAEGVKKIFLTLLPFLILFHISETVTVASGV